MLMIVYLALIKTTCNNFHVSFSVFIFKKMVLFGYGTTYVRTIIIMVLLLYPLQRTGIYLVDI